MLHPDRRDPPLRRAMTLVEILVVIVIIVVLAGLLLPAIALVKQRAHHRTALHTVGEVLSAIEAYRDEDQRHRYPPVNADASLSLRALPGPGEGVLELLDRKGLWSPAVAVKDDQGRLLDPFGAPYRYTLARPAPTAPSGALEDWNWDPVAGHERRWGRRPLADGTISDGPEAYPYVWSLGRGGSLTDATTWIYVKDGR